jgi:hypothetical protein
MSGGGGKSSGKTSDVTALMPYISMFEGETKPVRQTALSQALEGLQTGGVGARIPMIQNAVAQSQGALGATLQNMRSAGAGAGLSNSPFLTGEMGSTAMAGRQQVAGIGPGMVSSTVGSGMNVFSQILNAMSGQRVSSGATSAKNTQTGLL